MMGATKKKIGTYITIFLMFIGILVGWMVILLEPKKNTPASLHDIVGDSDIRITDIRATKLKDVISIIKTRRKLIQLKQKARLTKEDSLAIKQIDHQLNQLIHD